MNPIEIILSFLEGVALIASPCILPILPLILSTSIDGGRRRPLGIIMGFILTFTIFALLSRELVSILHINLNYIKYGSLIIITILGIVMLSEKLSGFFASLTQNFANIGTPLSNNTPNGFLSGILIGGVIGLVWTPCAGPILAIALVEIIRQKNSLSALVLVLAFAIGAGIPMLTISLIGRKFITKLKFLSANAIIIRKILGVAVLLAVIFIGLGINPQTLFSTPSTIKTAITNVQLQNSLLNPYQAPEFAKSDIWLSTPNNQPLTMNSLKGKVVLVDFWTYSCINCIRTLPYLNSWYQKYESLGLVIVGVHSPEFEFEKNQANVIQAIAKDGIKYPVAMDNNLDTWTNFNNQFWPAHYLIDKTGKVVYTSFGEGDYDITENNIRVLLGMNSNDSTQAAEASFNLNQTPETYLGYERAQAFASPQLVLQNGITNYTLPSNLANNQWALQGRWLIEQQRIIPQSSNTKLELNFNAKHVYLVLGSPNNKPVNLLVKLNGKALLVGAGKDAPNGVVTVKEHRLYELINQDNAKNGLLEINIPDSGVELYAFTFG